MLSKITKIILILLSSMLLLTGCANYKNNEPTNLPRVICKYQYIDECSSTAVAGLKMCQRRYVYTCLI